MDTELLFDWILQYAKNLVKKSWEEVDFKGM